MKKCCENIKTPYCPTCGSKIVVPIVYDLIAQRVAVELHREFCSEDHSERCLWAYEVKEDNHFEFEWGRPVHQKYYAIAQEVLKVISEGEILEGIGSYTLIKQIMKKLNY
jgi:ribose 1,5-bisphosphokinase PhnN